MAEYSLEQAFGLIAGRIIPICDEQTLALAAARGRVLSRALVSPRDLPEHDLAAMDGYAVRAADLAPGSNRLAVLGRVLAGQRAAIAVSTGNCVRIMTGAAMPAGSDAVVIQEAVVDEGAGTVVVPGPVRAGANRRVRGEHVREAETVFTAGRRLRGTDLALAAAMGFAQLPVRRAVHVGVLSTGDELRDPPQALGPGEVYDSNRPMVLNALDAASHHAVDLGICPDHVPALQRIIDRAFAQRLDAILISGGAALGDADIVRSLEGVEFVPVNVRPGRGLAVAQLQRDGRTMLVLGLPGNAVAAFVLLHALALPLLARLGGADSGPPKPLVLALARDASARGGRVDLRRARLIDDDGGRRCVDPLTEQGSAMIRSVCAADALVAIGPAARYSAGDPVAVYPLDGFVS
jgi:molybdopterin molybdotransferase